MSPRESPPVVSQGAEFSAGGRDSMLSLPRPTGCLCGHVAGEPCTFDRPVSDRDGHCCGPVPLAALARGYGCGAHGSMRWAS